MDQVEASQTHGDPPETRPDYWRRVLARGAGKSPNAEIRQAIKRAAKWSAEACRLLDDPSASTNAKVRAESTARRERRDLAALIGTSKPKQKLGPDSLRQYAASKQASA